MSDQKIKDINGRPLEVGDIVKIIVDQQTLNEYGCNGNPDEEYEIEDIDSTGSTTNLNLDEWSCIKLKNVKSGPWIKPRDVKFVKKPDKNKYNCPECKDTGKVQLLRFYVLCKCQEDT